MPCRRLERHGTALCCRQALATDWLLSRWHSMPMDEDMMPTNPSQSAKDVEERVKEPQLANMARGFMVRDSKKYYQLRSLRCECVKSRKSLFLLCLPRKVT
eukprot:1159671-Pelagomonas_calceolata.AAC.3